MKRDEFFAPKDEPQEERKFGARGVALVGADIGSSVPIRVSKTPAQSKFGVQNKGIS